MSVSRWKTSALSIMVAGCGFMAAAPANAQSNSIRVTEDFQGGDPSIIYYHGEYVLVTTQLRPADGGVGIKRSPTIEGLKTATLQTAFNPADLTGDGTFIAPDLWVKDNHLYIAYDTNSSTGKIVCTVGENIESGFAVANGNACTNCEDLSAFDYRGVSYLLYSDFGSIKIAQLSYNSQDNSTLAIGSPVTIVSRRPPEDGVFDFELVDNPSGCCVEGPSAFVDGDQLTVGFSGNDYHTKNYATGLAHFSSGPEDNVLDAANWTDLTAPTRDKSWNNLWPDQGLYGTSSVYFFRDASGAPWFAYHARTDDGYHGLEQDNRAGFAKRLNFSNGLPDFGTP